MRGERVARTGVFVLLTFLLVLILSSLFVPSFDSQHGKNSATIRGLYNQPNDSIQVLFLGTSSMLSLASPVDLYEQTGVASYNCSARAQSLLVSYFLMREAYRLNPHSLKMVVIDPVKAVEEDEQEEVTGTRAKQSLLLMDSSPVKAQALWEASSNYDKFNFFETVLPVFAYHTRWRTLTSDDYNFFAEGDASLDFSSHGYFARFGSRRSAAQAAGWLSRARPTEERNYSVDELDAAIVQGGEYLRRIAQFCDERSIKLMFLKTSRFEWSDLQHDAVQQLADELGVEFVDANLSELEARCGFDYALDFVDTKHGNALGARKFTKFVGDLLQERLGGVGAVLGDTADAGGAAKVGGVGSSGSASEGSGFSGSDLESRERELEDAELFGCGNLSNYIEMLRKDRYVAFAATQGTNIDLNDDMRAILRDSGLATLSGLQKGQYYYGVIVAGKGIRGYADFDQELVFYRTGFDGRTLMLMERTMQSGAVLDDAVEIQAGIEASITVQGTDLCVKGDGLNIVVYDTEIGELIDSACFSLSAPYDRLDIGMPVPE